uniref:DUF4371 domain-containing protein n=1 Tax=Oryzias latipes TaxID=8090 RepID=H2L9V8_ORYLA
FLWRDITHPVKSSNKSATDIYFLLSIRCTLVSFAAHELSTRKRVRQKDRQIKQGETTSTQKDKETMTQQEKKQTCNLFPFEDLEQWFSNGVKKKTKQEATKSRKYNEDYVLMGFTSTSSDPPEALMKPAHLQRHLTTTHGCHVGKAPEFFRRKLSEFKSSQATMPKVSTTSAKALEASYAVSLLVAKAKKPFTIAETYSDTLKTVPLSNDTVCRRIDTMGADIIEQVVGKLGDSFSLQLDESTYLSGHAQLVAFVRYIDTDDICEHILFCKEMEGRTTGEDIFNVVNMFISWKSCSRVCTDAAASMTGLIARIKKENPDIKWTHCVIHREALASKKMSPVLHDVLNDSIKVLNFIRSRPLNARLFRSLCENTGAEHTELLLHTEVCWLSRGRVLSRLFELRAEVHTFLTEHGSPHATMFENTDWLAKLCYLADIFRKLSELNMSLQGKDTSILNQYDKVGGFLKKAEMWKRACDQEDFTCFPQLDVFLSNEDVATAPVKLVIVGHLANLISGFHSYFPVMDEKSVQLDWVRNPFLLSEANRSKLPVTHQEKLMEVSSDRGLQMKFGASTLTQFWLCERQEHPELGQKALEQLLPFASTYLCEASFSAMMLIKTKQRNRGCLEKSLITAVASLPPRMTKILSEVQAHISH